MLLSINVTEICCGEYYSTSCAFYIYLNPLGLHLKNSHSSYKGSNNSLAKGKVISFCQELSRIPFHT